MYQVAVEGKRLCRQAQQGSGSAVQGSGLCLVLLTGSPDSFFRLSEARAAMEAQLRDGGRLQVQQASCDQRMLAGYAAFGELG